MNLVQGVVIIVIWIGVGLTVWSVGYSAIPVVLLAFLATFFIFIIGDNNEYH
jgi:hypothetical protein